jgi:hypothetical protein
MKNTARYLLFLLLMLYGWPAYSQMKITFVATDWDSTYINKFPSLWSLRVFSVSKDQTFRIENRENRIRVDFEPNSKAAIGLGLSYSNFALDIGVTVSNQREVNNEITNSFDFLSSLYTGQHIADFSFQVYRGFFSVFSLSADSVIRPFRNDLRTFTTGINYQYNFNHRRFSFNAPFVGTQIQKISAGTPLAGVYFTYYDLRADSTILPAESSGHFNSEAQISEANLLAAGITGGYAHTFVLPGSFFICLSLTPGMAFNLGQAKTDLYYNFGNPVTVSPKVVSKNSIGYGGEKFYGLISLLVDRNFVNLSNRNQLNYNLTKFKMVAGYRF